MVLPCFDEEDNGVPPICMKSTFCPFHPSNPVLATSFVARTFANVGFPYFDRHRKGFFGFAVIWTILAFICTLYGCLAVINHVMVIRWTYWASGVSYDEVLPRLGTNYTGIFIGLRGYILTACSANKNATYFCDIGEDTDCDPLDPPFSLNTQADFECDEYLYAWDEDNIDETWYGTCEAACNATLITALTSCFPMIFAIVGAMNRMRFSADSPQQKILGCVTDSLGAVSLAIALRAFEQGCFYSMKRENVTVEVEGGVDFFFDKIYWWRGHGYWVYWLFCFSGGVLRAVLHWITPLPGYGSNTFSLSWVLPSADQKAKRQAIIKEAHDEAVKAREARHATILEGIQIREAGLKGNQSVFSGNNNAAPKTKGAVVVGVGKSEVEVEVKGSRADEGV